MPHGWCVFLNCRLANPGGPDREFDALVVTEKALHIIEFKNRKHPVSIDSEENWQSGGRPMENGIRRESPQTQVVKTSDALKDVLKRRLPELHRNLAPWVVLENANHANSYGGEPFVRDRYQRSGITWIVNGVTALPRLIDKREKTEDRLKCATLPPITTSDRGRLIKLLGAQPLGRMSVKGRVLALRRFGETRALPDIEITLELDGKTHGSDRTDQEGCFEFLNLHVRRFRLLPSSDHQDLRFIGSEPRAARPGFVSAELYALEPALTEEDVDQLVEAQLEQTKQELERERQSFEHRLSLLESERDDFQKRLSDHEGRLLEVMEANPDAPEAEGLRSEITELRAVLLRGDTLRATNLPDYVNSALASVRQDLADVRDHVDSAERSAHDAAESARLSETYQRSRARIESERHEAEKQAADARVESGARLREAMGWSVLVGGAGGVIALQPIPFADNFILTPMQFALLMKIGKIYEKRLTSDLALKLAATVGGGFLAQHGTILLYKLIPGAWGLGAITVPVYTILLGYLAALYFERGSVPTKAERSNVRAALRHAFTDDRIREQVREIGGYLVDEYRSRRKALRQIKGRERADAVYEMLTDVWRELSTRSQKVGDRILQIIEEHRKSD